MQGDAVDDEEWLLVAPAQETLSQIRQKAMSRGRVFHTRGASGGGSGRYAGTMLAEPTTSTGGSGGYGGSSGRRGGSSVRGGCGAH